MRRTPVVMACVAGTVAAVLMGAATANAEESLAKSPKVKMIKVPILMAINGSATTIDPIPGTSKFRMRITGTEDDVVWFTDRPARRAGHMSATALVNEWARVFKNDPPNSALDLMIDGQRHLFVVETTAPRYSNGVLAFTIEPTVSAGSAIPSRADEVELFIDDAMVAIPADPASQATVSSSTVSTPTGPASVTEGSSLPTPASDWTFHSIIPSASAGKYIAKTKLNQNQVTGTDNFLFSIPAAALIGQFTTNHLDNVSPTQGVQLSGQTNIGDMM